MPKFYGNSIDASPDTIKNLTALGYTFTNNPNEIGSGDLVLGGSGATGGISDNALNGATRLYGNDRTGTASAIQGFIQSKQTPQIDVASLIQQQAAQEQAAKLAAIQKAKEQAINGYNEQIGTAPAQYQPLRNQAAVNKETSLLANKENMANTGRFFSGDNMTEQGKINNQFSGDVNSANLQQQAFVDKLKNAIAQVNENSAYDSAQAVADTEASKLQALINQANSDREYGLNKQQVNWSEDVNNNPSLIAQIIQNKYLPQQLQGSITGTNLDNDTKALTLKYQPQILQGQIDAQKLQNTYQSLVNAGYNKSLAADLAYKAAETSAANRSNQGFNESSSGGGLSYSTNKGNNTATMAWNSLANMLGSNPDINSMANAMSWLQQNKSSLVSDVGSSEFNDMVNTVDAMQQKYRSTKEFTRRATP